MKGGLDENDPKMTSWKGHWGPREREVARLHKLEMNKLWKEKYETLVHSEIESKLKEVSSNKVNYKSKAMTKPFDG